MKYIENREFPEKAALMPVVDVRSPGEYLQGHIPGAFNIPLFTDDERSQVGTIYKNMGRSDSIRKGLEFVGPRMAKIVEEADSICPGGKMLIHCWRGGMRSEAMAWLFETAGFECHVLKGGYKAYRRYIRENIPGGWEMIVLGGLTGSGKTKLLKELQELGEPVIDLEGLANHKGSAFGGIGQKEQPTTEQFENNLFLEVSKIREPYFWVEDESLRIGKVFIPGPFYQQMLKSKVLFIGVPDEYRYKILVDEYSVQDKDKLIEAIRKIEPRLGNMAARQAVEAVITGDYRETAKILLDYYDKTYMYGLSRKNSQNVYRLEMSHIPPEEYALSVMEKKSDLLNKN